LAPIRGAECFKINSGRLIRNDEEEIFLAVTKKQIFGMNTGDVASLLARFVNGMNGSVLIRLGHDTQPFQIAQDFSGPHDAQTPFRNCW
jgi:hypothetical protein